MRSGIYSVWIVRSFGNWFVRTVWCAHAAYKRVLTFSCKFYNRELLDVRTQAHSVFHTLAAFCRSLGWKTPGGGDFQRTQQSALDYIVKAGVMLYMLRWCSDMLVFSSVTAWRDLRKCPGNLYSFYWGAVCHVGFRWPVCAQLSFVAFISRRVCHCV